MTRSLMALAFVAALAVGAGIGLLIDDNGSPDGAAAAVAAASDLFFVQSAESGGFRDGELRLEGVSPLTTTFADRPDRDSWVLSTQGFVDDFAALFGDDPPNGTVSSLDEGVGEFPVELSAPRYDADEGTLVYRVTPIGDADQRLPQRLGPLSLFIDSATGADFSGDVSDAGGPVAGATVSISGPVSASVVTDGLGDFDFGLVPAGDYQLSITSSSCNDRDTITLDAGENNLSLTCLDGGFGDPV